MTHYIHNIIFFQEQSTDAEVHDPLYTQHYFIIKNNQLMLRSMTHYIHNIICLSRAIN